MITYIGALVIHQNGPSEPALQCVITPIYEGYTLTSELRCSNMHSDEYVRLYAAEKGFI